jgi:hypothetical protein
MFMLNNILKTLITNPAPESIQICKLLNNSLVMGRNTQSVPFIIDVMGQTEYLTGLRELTSVNLVVSKLKHNFAEISVNTKTIKDLGVDLDEVVFAYKLDKYSLKNLNVSDHIPMVKKGKELDDVQIQTDILNRSHQHDFKFDVEMLEKYFQPIVKKLLEKIIEQKGEDYVFETSYEDVIISVLRQYIYADSVYNLGGCNFDQRYRTISLQLDKILNPIGYTIGRSLIKFVNPRTLTVNDTDAIDAIYLFIAQETVGSCIGDTIDGKIAIGKKSYEDGIIPDAIVAKIWIERIYSELDELFKNGSVQNHVPIELDATFSAKLTDSLLLGDVNGIKSCNGYTGEPLRDAWHIKGVTNRNIGKAMVGKLYGSNSSIKKLVGNKFAEMDAQQLKKEIRLVERAAVSGDFALMMSLKDLLIDGSNITTDVYTVNMLEMSYDVHIQKRKPVDTITTRYFTEINGILKMFKNTKVITIPDHKSHKTFFKTGLTHGLDWRFNRGGFQELEALTSVDGIERVTFHIHDAAMLSPLDAPAFREGVRKEMVDMVNNGDMILADYLESINVTIDGKPATTKAMRLMNALNKLRDGKESVDTSKLTGYCYK